MILIKNRSPFSFNEATLQKVKSTMISDVYLNDEFFEHFWGEGLCVSPPTGSTAYNIISRC